VTRRLRRGPRAAVTAALLAALLPAATGCAAGFGAETVQPYTPADGVNADAGPMKVRGATLVAEEPGGPANLIASFVNEADAPDRLTAVRLAEGGEEGDVTGGPVALPSGRLVQVGQSDGPHVTLEGPSSLRPGHFVAVELVFARAGTVRTDLLVQEPVEEYATLAPSPEPTVTETSTPGETATSDATESPEESPTDEASPDETETP
jgi:hypothetical protein